MTIYVYDHNLMDGDDLNDNAQALVAEHEADTEAECWEWYNSSEFRGDTNDHSISFTSPN